MLTSLKIMGVACPPPPKVDHQPTSAAHACTRSARDQDRRRPNSPRRRLAAPPSSPPIGDCFLAVGWRLLFPCRRLAASPSGTSCEKGVLCAAAQDSRDCSHRILERALRNVPRLGLALDQSLSPSACAYARAVSCPLSSKRGPRTLRALGGGVPLLPSLRSVRHVLVGRRPLRAWPPSLLVHGSHQGGTGLGLRGARPKWARAARTKRASVVSEGRAHAV